MTPRLAILALLAALAPPLAPSAGGAAEAVPDGRALFQGFAAFAAGAGATDRGLPAGFAGCASCHGVDGEGGTEGAAGAPAIRAGALAAPRDGAGPFASDAAILAAIERGAGRDGQPLAALMPRYRLTPAEGRALLGYLRRVGTPDDRPPGVSADAIRVAAVLPLSGPLAPRGRQALGGLREAADAANAAGGVHGRRIVVVEEDVAGGQGRVADDLAAHPVYAVAGAMWDPRDPTLERRLSASRVPVVASLVVRDGGGPPPGVSDLLPSRREQGALLETALARCPASGPRWLVGSAAPRTGTGQADRVFASAAELRTAAAAAGPAGCVAYGLADLSVLRDAIPAGWSQRVALPFPAAVLDAAGASLWHALGVAAGRVALEAIAAGGSALHETSLERALSGLNGFEPITGAPLGFSERRRTGWSGEILSFDPPPVEATRVGAVEPE